jgi:dTDP-4-dehydrorhamnose 3,5-epimerase-like enzyme
MSHEVLPLSFERVDARGLFQEVLNEGHWEALLRGELKAGGVLGNHYHKRTVIFFHLTRGSAHIKTVHVETGERDEFHLSATQGVMLRTDESHAIRFLEDSEFIMLKSLNYNPDDPDTFPFPVEE